MMMTGDEQFLEETIIEILSKLPVKSLLRFRCICKSWCALFNKHNFISKHLNNDHNTRLIVHYMEKFDGPDESSYPLFLCSLFPDETLTNLSLQDLDNPVRGELVGPYNGIFCIFGNNNRITLWNRATKESRVLPKCTTVFPKYTSIFCKCTGFGLDPMSTDYKLVLIFTLWNEKLDLLYEFSHVAVYSLSTNSWRYCDCFKSNHYYMDGAFDSVYLDGVCYWLSEFRDNDHKVILSFHLGNEVFEEIQEPYIPESTPTILGIYNHSLCLLLLHNIENYYDIWVMKYKCWIKQLSLGPLNGVRTPLGFWKKGAFFVHSTNEQLLLYDPNTQEMRDLGRKSFHFSVHIYRESLIRVKQEDNLLDFDIPWHLLGVYQTDASLP
nr:SLF9 protein [Citrus maxima]